MKVPNAHLSRRKFNKLSAATLASIPFFRLSERFIAQTNLAETAIKVHLFSKHLQFLDYNEMSEAAAEMGFDGLDLTVRPKGHVIPEHVEDDLPEAVAAMKKFGLQPGMMTTNVWNANNPLHKKVLKTASQLNFTHYRTGWLKYPEYQSISQSQQVFAKEAKELELHNKSLNLTGCYQNHAGNHVGAPVWDLLPMLENTDNTHFGCQYDIRHAVVEGGSSWQLGLRRIQPYIKCLVIKDFKWGLVNGSWKPINTPLGQGMVDFKTYFGMLKKYQINVPISLHLEYDLGGAEHGAKRLTLPPSEVFKRMKTDLSFLKTTWLNA